MASIKKEIPVGDINGVNKVFTLLNEVSQIDDIWYDGAITTDFTRAGKVITLAYAPTASIFVDYDTSATSTDIVTNIKLGDVKTKIWRLLGQKASSTNFSPEVLNEEINLLMQKIWRGKVMNKLTKKIIRAGDLEFQENYFSFRIKKDTAVTSAVSVGDTTINMDTTGLNAQGWVLIGGDYIQYTSKTDTAIEGVSGITMSHNAGVNVKSLYVMPENYDIMLAMDEVQYFGGSVSYIPVEIDSGAVSYDIQRVSGTTLLSIQGMQYDTIVRTKYVFKYEKMTDDSEDFKLPDDYGLDVVAYIVAGQMGYDKMLMQSERLLNTGYDALNEMYGFFNNKTKDIKKKLRPKPYAKIGRTYR